MNHTTDSFFEGKIKIRQRENGYRFSIDPILIAHYAKIPKGSKIVDIGTGSGVIPLILTHLHEDCRVLGIEIQKNMAEMASRNIRDNGFEERIRILNMDFSEMIQADINGPADIIISNPPYRKNDSGRKNPESEKAIARHEIKLTLGQLLKKSGSLLKTGGLFHIIFPSQRLAELIYEMKNVNIEPKSTRMIHSFRDQPAKLVMISGKKGAQSGLIVDPPMIIYERENKYTEEVEKMMGA
ncbi:tRNA1(Val) (adenine(37)-N6)-methyltransferase [Desulforegula conservatrix]|uniref:tRNA1(Val) (adenine(37)-N6)-methyltransferase n=1 Tax=Desulforegula conservatrix TaxID=153026 RepID=UPI000401E32C|nr:tRNA1(Val) (adenine(37)-N6)-methyltransferase [Desulforegula conservatrix]